MDRARRVRPTVGSLEPVPTTTAAAPEPGSRSVLDPMHPFTTAQAIAAGIDPGSLRGRRYRRLSKGKYVSSQRRPSALLDAESALLGHPAEAVATHTTAARVFRLPVPDDAVDHVGVSHPSGRRRRSGVRSHVVSPRTKVVVVAGVRLSSPMDVFVQLADQLLLVELVVVGECPRRQVLVLPRAARCLLLRL